MSIPRLTQRIVQLPEELSFFLTLALEPETAVSEHVYFHDNPHSRGESGNVFCINLIT
jgi:hypothetical protein